VTREAIYEALKTRLLTLKPATVKDVSRVWRHWEQVDHILQPTVFLEERGEPIAVESGTPAIRSLEVAVWVYANRGNSEKQVPSTLLNNLFDAIDGALAPDPVTGFNTLGGLVAHCRNAGRNDVFEGFLGPQAVGTYMVEMLLNTDNLPGQQQYVFDAGTLFAVPNQRPDGTATDRTPIRIGALKGVVLNVSFAHSYPSSQLAFRFNAGDAGKTVTGNARTGWLNGYLFNQIMFGQELQTGSRHVTTGASQAVPASPHQITPTPPGGGSFAVDMGVVSGTTGLPLRKVTGSPATGQYSEAAGVYQFAAADEAALVAISYLYDLAGGSKLTMGNKFKVDSPTFVLVLSGSYNGKQMTVQLNRCITKAVALPTVVDRFMIMDFDFEALADSAGTVGTINVAQP